ncbi:Cysteine-rich protein 2 [Oryzias melastigma]|uniref:Cysteine-rich protein 2 n=1 Tax=Oryzias melastigma TaxID=30732 RepID=A0A834CTH5_ORYME|nr:Cysteine-rich protein 2 [Oryzias melastigma]
MLKGLNQLVAVVTVATVAFLCAAEKVSSLGKNWHRPCLRCERCSKTLAPGSHAEHDGQPYCHKPCYAVLFGPKGVNTGGVGSYIYDDPEAKEEP